MRARVCVLFLCLCIYVYLIICRGVGMSRGEGGGGVSTSAGGLAMPFSGQLVLHWSPSDTQLSPVAPRSCSMRQQPHPSELS